MTKPSNFCCRFRSRSMANPYAPVEVYLSNRRLPSAARRTENFETHGLDLSNCAWRIRPLWGHSNIAANSSVVRLTDEVTEERKGRFVRRVWLESGGRNAKTSAKTRPPCGSSQYARMLPVCTTYNYECCVHASVTNLRKFSIVLFGYLTAVSVCREVVSVGLSAGAFLVLSSRGFNST